MTERERGGCLAEQAEIGGMRKDVGFGSYFVTFWTRTKIFTLFVGRVPKEV